MNPALPRNSHGAAPAKISTGIPNLDYILDGGLHVFGSRCPAVIVKGVPGCGKSILSATIASAVCRQGHSVAYFTLEQKASDIQTMIRQFAWQPGPTEAEFLLDENYEKPAPESVADRQFLISHIPFNVLKAGAGDQGGVRAGECEGSASKLDDRDEETAGLRSSNEDFLNLDVRLQNHVVDRISKLSDCGIIVLDALSDVFIEEGTEALRGSFYLTRSLFLRVCDLASRANAVVIVVLEKKHEVSWRDYVADVVIDLSWQPDVPDGRLRRYIHVEKARFQAIMDGRHEMRIMADEGIVIYPAQTEVLREARQQYLNRPSRRRELKFGTNRRFNDMLEYPIVEGSASLLYGPDATRKNVLVAQFLQQGLQDNPDGNVLLLSVGATAEVAKGMVERYLDRGVLEDEAGKSIEQIMSRIIIRPLTGLNETPSELINEVRQILDGNRICRAALDDVAALVPNPEVAFPLKEFLTFRGVTSLFVHTTVADVDSPIRESFDTVIRARHLLLPNTVNARIGYHVRKLNGATKGSTRSWELIYSEKDRKLEINDAFAEYVESRDGRLHSLPLRLLLHCEYEDLKKSWEDRLNSMFGIEGWVAGGDAPAMRIFVRDEAEKVLDDILFLEAGYEMPETKVVNFDEYWAKELIEAGKLVCLDDLAGGESLKPFDERTLNKVRPLSGRKSDLFGLPQHIDCGFYTIRTDIVTPELVRRHGLSLDQPLDWHDLATLVKEAQQEYQTREATKRIQNLGADAQRVAEARRESPRCFDYCTHISESFICYILEVLWPFLFRDGDDDYRGFDDPAVIDAACHWYSALEAAESLPSPPGGAAGDAIVQRCWVISYWKALRDRPELKDHLRIIPAPCLVGNGPTARPAVSISGDWFLGIVKGSPNPGRGIWSMNALTSEATSRWLHETQLGLPAHKSLLTHGEGKEFYPIYQSSVSRVGIPHYRDVRKMLIERFADIFCEPGRNSADIEKALMDLNERIAEQQGRAEQQQDTAMAKEHETSPEALWLDVRELDTRIVELMERRVALVEHIAETAANMNAKLFVWREDASTIRQVLSASRGVLAREDLTRIYHELLSVCGKRLNLQPQRVACLGPAGSFTHLAASRCFRGNAEYVLEHDNVSVFEKLLDREVDFAVVAATNSRIGARVENLDLLAESLTQTADECETPLRVCGEIALRVEYCLLGTRGMEDIKSIHSHAQGFKQCRQQLDALQEAHGLQHAERVLHSSTSEAAKKAAGEPSAAAVANRLVAELWPLRILKEHLEDDPRNTTRFLIVGREQPPRAKANRTSLAFRCKNEPGALVRALNPAAQQNVNIQTIVTRPVERLPWAYSVFLDLDGHIEDPPVRTALEEMKAFCLRGHPIVLGSYPKTVDGM